MNDSTNIEHADDVDISDIGYIRELETKAQQAAEERLELAHALLDDDPELEDAAADLAAPYCGCITCEVREILDAAWPFLQRLAASTCWCGGHRGPRTPADADGWGCLEDINHQGERIAEEPPIAYVELDPHDRDTL